MSPSTINVGPGVIVHIDDCAYCIRKWVNSSTLLARNLVTMADEEIELSRVTSSNSKSSELSLDLLTISDEKWDEALEKYQAIKHLVGKPDRNRAEIGALAEELFVSTATLYRWLNKIETYGSVTCLLRKVRKDKGVKALDPHIEKVVEEAIASEFLTNQNLSPSQLMIRIASVCRKRGLKSPSKGAVLQRIDEIFPAERERKRRGRNAALPFTPIRGSLPGVDHVHAVWQIDHTMVDIELVDSVKRLPIGRPWITVAIDTFSRTIVGWYISFDPPGAVATGICIATAILPKTELLINLGVTYEWPCMGKPRAILADNAKEFRGDMLKMASHEHGFNMKFRKVKKPNYGAHMERLLGTLMREVHALSGTTFSNVKQKGEYDSAGKAVMTLDEFELWLANLILGSYHQRHHSELGCAPIKKYNDGIFGDGDTPGIGLIPIAANPEKLRIDFLPFDMRTIQQDGVVWDHIKYHDPVLDKWIGALDPESRKKTRKFIFRRDPRNISTLIFWDPDVRLYYQIPYRDISRPAISLWELKRVQTYLAAQGKADIDEDTIFAARDEMLRIEASAKSETKRVRRENERKARHERLVPSNKIQTQKLEEPPQPDSAPSKLFDLSAVKPYDEIEPA